MQVVIAPNPALRVQTKPVKKITPGLLQTTKDMIKLTKSYHDPEGVGMASTQVGLDGQFFVALLQQEPKKPETQLGGEDKLANTSEVRKEEKFLTVFNPQIIWKSKRVKKYFEGCLSIPNYWGEVERHFTIKVTYQDETGKTINATLKGVIAWIFQHEVDHLNGKLFPDRVLEQKGKFYKFIGKDKTGTDNFEEIKI